MSSILDHILHSLNVLDDDFVERPFRDPRFIHWVRCYLARRSIRGNTLRVLSHVESGEPAEDESPYFRQGWIFERFPVDLPDWYESNRVQGSTRLRINSSLGNSDFRTDFKEAASAFEQLGAKVYMRHVKSGDEDPPWPSVEPARTVAGAGAWSRQLQSSQPTDGAACSEFCEIPAVYSNIVEQIMVQDANDHGLLLIGYYRHMAECRIAELRPQWVCKQPTYRGAAVSDRSHWIKEASINGKMGYHLDLSNDDYRKIVLERLKELAHSGIKGFNFDYRHMPPHGSWGSDLERSYLLEPGSPMVPYPAPLNAGSLDDLNYRKYLDYQAYKVEETFAYWIKNVKAEYPEVIFSISTTTLPSLSNRRMTTNLARLADGAKNEWSLALNKVVNRPMETLSPPSMVYPLAAGQAVPEDDLRMALGWTLLRDAADGRPPRIWAPNFPNRDHAYAFAAALIAYGAIANMNVSESLIHDLVTGQNTAPDWCTPQDGLEAAFELGNLVGPVLGKTLPLKWAAVHFSESARNRRGADLGRAWKEVLWPLVGAYGVFVRQGLPVRVINDYQLEIEPLEPYKILFLPNPQELSERQRVNVVAFVGRGGILLEKPAGAEWSGALGVDCGSGEIKPESQCASEKFAALLRDLIYCQPAPVQVRSSASKMHAVAFKDRSFPRYVAAITNDFSWVQTHGGDTGEDADDPSDPSTVINNRPPDITDAIVYLFGLGRPINVREVVKDIPLVAETIGGGYRIALPTFPTLAVVEIKF